MKKATKQETASQMRVRQNALASWREVRLAVSAAGYLLKALQHTGAEGLTSQQQKRDVCSEAA